MAELVTSATKYYPSWLEASLEFDGVRRDGAGGDVSFDVMQNPVAFL